MHEIHTSLRVSDGQGGPVEESGTGICCGQCQEPHSDGMAHGCGLGSLQGLQRSQVGERRWEGPHQGEPVHVPGPQGAGSQHRTQQHVSSRSGAAVHFLCPDHAVGAEPSPLPLAKQGRLPISTHIYSSRTYYTLSCWPQERGHYQGLALIGIPSGRRKG